MNKLAMNGEINAWNQTQDKVFLNEFLSKSQSNVNYASRRACQPEEWFILEKIKKRLYLDD